MNGGVIEVVDENVLMATFDHCLALDASFDKIKSDCEILGTYSNEITYPGGMVVSMKDAKAAIKMALKVEGFMKSKLKPVCFGFLGGTV